MTWPDADTPYEEAIAMKAKAIQTRFAEVCDSMQQRDDGTINSTNYDNLGDEQADIVNRLPEVFSRFNTPNPKDFDPLIEQYARMALQLDGGSSKGWGGMDTSVVGSSYPTQTVSEQATKARDTVSNWQGDARDTFIDNFIHRYETTGATIVSQRQVINVFQAAVEAHQKVFITAREDMNSLADKVYAALEESDECSSDDVNWVAVSLTAVVGVLAVPLTAGGSLALTAVAAAGSIASTAIASSGTTQAEPETVVIESSNPLRIIDQAKEGIDKIIANVETGEKQIRSTLEELSSAIADAAYNSQLVGPDVRTRTGEYPLITQGYLDEFAPD